MTDQAIASDSIPTSSDRRSRVVDERSMRALELCLAGLAIAVVIALSLLR